MSKKKILAIEVAVAVAVGAMAGYPACGYEEPNAHLQFKNRKSTIDNPLVWSFRVGGYQVCEKWLKDRKGRTLDYADIQHYQKIFVALGETIGLMAAIDQAIDAQGGWPEAFGGAWERRRKDDTTFAFETDKQT